MTMLQGTPLKGAFNGEINNFLGKIVSGRQPEVQEGTKMLVVDGLFSFF